MNSINNSIWDIINSYFNSTKNYLTKNQIDTYNTFINVNIPKTIRQFNPIVLPYSKIEGTDKYKYELEITIGGSLDLENMSNVNNWSSTPRPLDISEDKREINIEIKPEQDSSVKIPSILNDGKGVYVGKPIIQKKFAREDSIEYKESILFPNEARLKNITYQSDIRVDVIIKYTSLMRITSDESAEDSPIFQKKIKIMKFDKVGLCNIPIMLQSKICSLHNMDKNTLRLAGECEYDQGGYFIIDGKEKVIVAQERQIENKLYINKLKNNDVKLQCEVRSSPENKFQPARITKIMMMKEKSMLDKKNIKKISIKDNLLRVVIPHIDTPVPLFLVFRALGIISDWEIINTIIGDVDLKHKGNTKYVERILEVLRPSILDTSFINSQSSAIDFLMNNISKTFLSSGDKYRKKKFIIEILRNHFIPHCGENLLDKGYFLGHMVMETVKVQLNINKETDRDSFMYKRVDISGFLISSIFRDLYFRIKNKLIETCNIKYNNRTKFIIASSEETSIDNSSEYWDKNFNNFIGHNNDINSELNIRETIDRLIMDEGFMYAFKNCWGLKNAPCKQGVVQDINRISYIGFISHLRRINTPLSSSAKIRAPHSLHGSSWGIMCPSETPDGGNVGLRKNLAILSSITFGTNSKPLERLLFTSEVYDIKTKDVNKNVAVKIFLNEILIGYTYKPRKLYKKLKLLKRNALINIYTSISWYTMDKIMKIATTSGRGIRPVFVVDKKQINILRNIDNTEYNILDKLKDKSINWEHLVGGLIHKDKSKPFSDINENYIMNKDSDGNLIEYDLLKLAQTQGIIEYIDCEESNTSLISINSDKLDSYDYNYCEISPSLILGVLGNLIPSVSMNQAPRNQFSSCHAKQALGLYATNFRNRFDTKGQILNYPQKPLVKSKLSKYLNADNLPHGINAIVAIGCFSGYNQEDSIIFNKDSVEKGLFCSTKFRSYSYRDEYKNGKIVEKIVFPDMNRVVGLKQGDYTHLDKNGIIKEETHVKEDNIIVSKNYFSDELDDNGNQVLYDKSVFVKRNESGIIDRVYSNTENNNERFCKIRIRKSKKPELGDKFASRHGQKGTVGMLIPAVDMPRSKNGLVPDLIVNAHAFPSRMTIGQFLELILGKSVVNLGMESDIVSFSLMNNGTVNYLTEIQNILEEKCGFNRNGEEVMYSGITGKLMKINYFMGPTFYQRLTHQVSDKIQSRTTGPRTALSHQPVGGRALGGGGRVGEMERDCLLSHGAVSFLKESFMERSDKYNFWISYKTGLISAINPSQNIYRDLSSDETKQYLDIDKVKKIATDTTNSEFFCVEAPYSFKLLIQEIEALGISPRLVGSELKQKWDLLNKLHTPNQLVINEKMVLQLKQDIIDDEMYYTKSGTAITSEMRRFHNKIKYNLLSLGKNNINFERGNSNLIDFSVGRGGDLYKWAQLGFRNILGIDLSSNNIEAKQSEDEGGISGAIERLQNLAQSDNPRIAEWYSRNEHNIEFLVGDTSIKMYNPLGEFNEYGDELVEIGNMCDGLENSEKYRGNYIDYLAKVGNNRMNRFGIATSFFTIHYLFNKKQKIENFFINASHNLLPNGYLLITCFDGKLVFDALKKNNFKSLKGFAKDEHGNKTQVWKIKATSTDKLQQLKELPYSTEKGFNNNISVKFKSISDRFLEESLVHPVLLITMAYKFGFKLVPLGEVKNIKNIRTTLFDKPTGLFKDLHKKYMKSSGLKNIKFNKKIGNDLTTYSNFHRYFIFKKMESHDFEGYKLKTEEMCKKYLGEYVTNYTKFHPDNTRFKDVKLNFVSALDNYSITKFIDIPRSYLGINNNTKEINTVNKDDDSLERRQEFPNLYRRLFKLQQIKNIYGDINTLSYKNSMKYISNYVKTGIYIKIVNNTLYQFIPIINIGNDYKDLELFHIVNSELSKVLLIGSSDDPESDIKPLDNLETYLDKKYRSEPSDHYYPIDDDEKLQFVSFKKNIKLLLDNCQVSFGKDIINKLLPKFYIYYNLITDAIKQGVNDIEFIINILDSPIVRYHNQQLYNPSIILNKDCSVDIHKVSLYKSQKILPILSSKVSIEDPSDNSDYIYSEHSYNNYIDILVPDWYSYAVSKNLVYPGKCYDIDFVNNSDCDSVQATDHQPSYDFITVVIDIDNCNVVDKINYNNLIDKNSGNLRDKFQESGETGAPDLFFDVGSISMTHYTNQIHTDADSENVIKPNPRKPEKFKYNPKFSKYVLYIEDIGCNDILTRCLQFKKPLIIIRSKYNRRLWYDEKLIAYNADTHNIEEANYLEINTETDNYEELYDEILSITNSITPIVYNSLEKNMTDMVNKVFNNDTGYITSIMRDSLNIFSKNITKKKIDIKIKHIHTGDITKEVTLPKNLLGVIKGKDQQNIKKIEYISHTRISFKEHNDTIIASINGDIGDVLIAIKLLENYQYYQYFIINKNSYKNEIGWQESLKKQLITVKNDLDVIIFPNIDIREYNTMRETDMIMINYPPSYTPIMTPKEKLRSIARGKDYIVMKIIGKEDNITTAIETIKTIFRHGGLDEWGDKIEISTEIGPLPSLTLPTPTYDHAFPITDGTQEDNESPKYSPSTPTGAKSPAYSPSTPTDAE